jgi:hypothetical protein
LNKLNKILNLKKVNEVSKFIMMADFKVFKIIKKIQCFSVLKDIDLGFKI